MEGDLRCEYCGRMRGNCLNHRDRYGKAILVCEECLRKECAENLNEHYKRHGDIRRYNEARRKEQYYRRYYAREGDDRRPLP
jgi:hypothetical protein